MLWPLFQEADDYALIAFAKNRALIIKIVVLSDKIILLIPKWRVVKWSL